MVLSRHRPDRSSLNPPIGSQAGGSAMSFQMNRMLDVVVSFAAVGLALTLAGATAVLGA